MAKPSSPSRKALPAAAASKLPRATVGVRLSEDDKETLGQVAPGQNLSDAMRAMIAQARQTLKAPASFDEALGRIQACVGSRIPGQAGLERSRVVEDVVREAEHLLALLATTPVPPAEREVLEARIVDRGFDLVDRLMQAALLEDAPAWNPRVVRQRLERSRPLLVAAIAAVAAQNLPRSPVRPE